MAHSFLAHPQIARLVLPLCALAVIAGGLFFAAHGQASAAHAVSYLTPPVNIR